MQNKEEKAEKVKKSEIALHEEKILKFWEENKIFEKSVNRDAPKGEFSFYDGPPFATGEPHYGHLLPTTMKDIIPRFRTMQGYRVERIWGWDCHGLPVENVVEKELGLNTKKDIQDYGVDKFNEKAREAVTRYEMSWKEVIPRIGRWVDMENDYKTMDSTYTESIWWSFSNLYNRDLIYEGYKSMHLCPRCETTLSNFEVNQGYQDIKDLSVYAKFELVDQPGTYLLAWTTTPWTLPGNVALAVGKDIEYIQVTFEDKKYILGKELLESVFEGKEYADEQPVSTKDLVGKSYLPVFDYYSKDASLENHTNGWKIYGADFVTTDEGTGIVHIAPAFGSDDYELAQKENLPFVQHVKTNGHFVPEVTDFADLPVKPKGDHMSTDIEIIKWLAHNDKLFAKKKIEHSYPHCWRCDTPLINYAANSWFVGVTNVKEQLVKNNRKTEWVPSNMRDGRFGKWLEGARDWAISRSRYWGAPLPVWQDESGKERVVIGSLEELKQHMKTSGNTYFLMRHGESEGNTKHQISSNIENNDPITEKGKGQIKETITELKKKNIDLIVASPFMRTKQTAEMVAEELGVEIFFEERIREMQVGKYEGRDWNEYHDYVMQLTEKERYETQLGGEGGESFQDIKNRVGDVLYELEEKYSGKNILIVSHGTPLWMMFTAAHAQDEHVSDYEHPFIQGFRPFQNAELRHLPFLPLPHNHNYDLDLHRPYVDDVILVGKDGAELRRVPEVFDCWYESGSMPYASLHYPFENKEKFNTRFPADFIAEGLDQTRGWFYSLMVLSTTLFDQPTFKNVIVNGIIMAEDGKKMSKRLKNYPPIDYMINKYGADALRLFLINSPAVRAEEVSLSEKGVTEVLSKVMGRLRNVLSFYELYREENNNDPYTSPYVLDQWILSRLEEFRSEVTKNLEAYELDRAARPIFSFVDDLSTWYVRRSRDRFKGADEKDRAYAGATLHHVLLTTAHIIAPFTPFLAEEVYEALNEKTHESIHLGSWPEKRQVDKKSLEQMEKVRAAVSTALELRDTAGVRVRQPLSRLQLPISDFHGYDQQYLDVIKDEINVKEITLGEDYYLDIELTPELKAEGDVREFIRHMQSLRKQAGLHPDDVVTAHIQTDTIGQGLIEKFKDEIVAVTNVAKFIYEPVAEGKEFTIDKLSFIITINS